MREISNSLRMRRQVLSVLLEETAVVGGGDIYVYIRFSAPRVSAMADAGKTRDYILKLFALGFD